MAKRKTRKLYGDAKTGRFVTLYTVRPMKEPAMNGRFFSPVAAFFRS